MGGIEAYDRALDPHHAVVCDALRRALDAGLPDADSKIWHGHPVWFLGKNPIVGYSKQKRGIRLMFWSGADFGEPCLDVLGKKFKDASVYLSQPSDVDALPMKRLLSKSNRIQWDYANIAKRKGVLERVRPSNRL